MVERIVSVRSNREDCFSSCLWKMDKAMKTRRAPVKIKVTSSDRILNWAWSKKVSSLKTKTVPDWPRKER